MNTGVSEYARAVFYNYSKARGTEGKTHPEKFKYPYVIFLTPQNFKWQMPFVYALILLGVWCWAPT